MLDLRRRSALHLAAMVMTAMAPLALHGQTAVGSDGDRILLLARGDDIGFTHSSNLAMVEGFEQGIMRSASILIVAPWAAEAVELAKANPHWNVGLHLTLTSNWDNLRWRPAAPAGEVPSLVAPDGHMYAGGYFWTPPPVAELEEWDRSLWAPAPPNAAEVETELRAQIELARAMGLRIDHIDCHEGNACNTALFHIVKQLSRELCVPIGTMRQLGEAGTGPRFGDATTPAAVKAEILEWLESIGPGLWGTVTHPVLDVPEVRAISDWEAGLSPFLLTSLTTQEAWTSPEVAEVIRRRGIQLVSYRDVWDYDRCEPLPLERIPRRSHSRAGR